MPWLRPPPPRARASGAPALSVARVWHADTACLEPLAAAPVLQVGAARLAVGTFCSALAAAQGHDIVLQQLRAGGPAAVTAINQAALAGDGPATAPGAKGLMGKRPAGEPGRCAGTPAWPAALVDADHVIHAT